MLIGSDCPDNRCHILRKAFKLLDTYPCVLGPTFDGGYYLIGFALEAQSCTKEIIQHTIKQFFEDILWGSEKVFAQTCAKINTAHMPFALLPKRNDVDTALDIPKKISIIIPTLNEENSLKRLFGAMPRAFNAEIIVVDAHSNDNTIAVAETYGALALTSARGRFQQIQTGAQAAKGEILLFLHADSLLPQDWDRKVRNALAQKHHSLGYFRFGIMEKFWSRPLVEWGTRMRCACLQRPYGDQGLFVRKKDFLQWNLPNVPILEDVFLVKKAREQGRLVALPDTLYTSGRRWFKHGFLRTSLINHSVMLCAALGMDLHLIAKAYRQGQNPLMLAIKKFIRKDEN